MVDKNYDPKKPYLPTKPIPPTTLKNQEINKVIEVGKKDPVKPVTPVVNINNIPKTGQNGKFNTDNLKNSPLQKKRKI